MFRFLLGAACVVIVHLIGWPRVEAALDRANAVTRAAYTAAEAEVSK